MPNAPRPPFARSSPAVTRPPARHSHARHAYTQTHTSVQKLLSLVLLAILGLALAAPALTGGQASESTLPACCRRAGLHHCAMHHNAPSPTGTRLATLTERCPFTPSGPPIAHLAHWSTAPGTRSLALLLTLLIGLAQTECLRRIARDRARGKRGPPTLARA